MPGRASGDEVNDDELHLGDYLEILRRRWLTIAVALTVVVVAAVGLSFMTKPKYRAEARVLVRTTAAQDRLDPSSNANNTQAMARRLQNEVEFAKSNGVEQAVWAAYGVDFEDDVSVKPESDSDTLTIAATAGTAQEAADRANSYATTLVAKRTQSTAEELLGATKSLTGRIAEIGTERDGILKQVDAGGDRRRFEGQLGALDREEANLRASLREIQIAQDLAVAGAARITKVAELPTAPFEPAWTRNVALAIVVGLVLGVGLALLLETLDGTVRTKAQLDTATGLPNLGLIPTPLARRASGRPGIITARAGPFVESMRSLRASINFARADDPDISVFAVTSPSPAEGKTTTVVNLALAFARSGQSVVVLETDLRRPRAGIACGVGEDRAGLSDVLSAGEALTPLPEQITGSGVFDVVPAGRKLNDPTEFLSADRVAGVIADLRAKYEIVLIDTSPVLPVADGLTVASVADATVLVAQAERSTDKQLRSAVELLQRADANLVGTILTNVDRQREYGRYGYGYGYGSSSSAEKD